MLHNNSRDFLILIPAYNEEKTIKKIIKKINKFGKVLVVNDASEDKTKKISISAGALVINHKKNLGYNKAIDTGLKFFLKSKFKKIILIDADGQHPTENIKDFKEYLNLENNVVCGVRKTITRIGEKIFIKLSSIVWNLNDPLCGMKGYSKSFLKVFYKPANYNFIGTEYLIKAQKKKIKIKEIMIKNKPRKDHSRFGEGFSTNLSIIFTFFKCVLLIK